MYKITQSPTFWNKARAEVTGEDGTKAVFEIECQFKRLPLSKVRELNAKFKDDNFDAPHWYLEVMVGWKGVLDAENNTVPFNPETLQDALDQGWGMPFQLAFNDGYPKAKQKN